MGLAGIRPILDPIVEFTTLQMALNTLRPVPPEKTASGFERPKGLGARGCDPQRICCGNAFANQSQFQKFPIAAAHRAALRARLMGTRTSRCALRTALNGFGVEPHLPRN